MPCFKGLAVSIHTPDGPLSEYSIQKQSKFSRITSYIPVPPAKIPPDSLTNKPEQSTFAISITLLTPGLHVPYSTPKASPENPYPRPKVVGGLPGQAGGEGQQGGVVGPYLPLTSSPNETIAAYIYFDGRQKEEVATLLRRGEETWVNSRWVSVPESEGGGLAEREFLFREVGLERWLNGLDLEGKDAAAKIERRKQRLEKRRRRRKESKNSGDEEEMDVVGDRRVGSKDVLRYGADPNSPIEKMSDEDDLGFSSDSDSDSDPPPPEAAGQIKVALFRVLASGEIKRGEYSPQFDAHDDDEAPEGSRAEANGASNGGSNEEDIDHTTSFAKPKSLDPKSISTQTVTGIDGPEKPYATFTFLYRGERQLQKMGILAPANPQERPSTASTKRRSVQTDFSKLGPLKTTGTLGFSTFRDGDSHSPLSKGGMKARKDRDSANDADSDDDDDEDEAIKLDDADVKDTSGKGLLNPEDARTGGELAEGVRKIKLKRAHSAEPLTENAPRKTPSSNTPTGSNSPAPPGHDPSRTPPSAPIDVAAANATTPKAPDEALIGSPMKKQRPSVAGFDDDADTIRQRLGMGPAGNSMGDGLFGPKLGTGKTEDDEEL